MENRQYIEELKWLYNQFLGRLRIIYIEVGGSGRLVVELSFVVSNFTTAPVNSNREYASFTSLPAME